MRGALLLEQDSPHVSNYLESLAQAKGLDEIALVEAGTATAKAGPRWKRFPTRAQLLREFRPEFVVVTHPAAKTPPVVAEALEAGCHVLVEKPACVKAADFAPLARMADSKHRFLMLAVVNRAHPLLVRARELVRGGAIGRPYAAHILLAADQTRLKTATYQKSWFNFRNQTMGGFLSWLSIHYLDMLQYLTGDSFESVSAITKNANRLPIEVEDSVAAALATRGGMTVTLHGGYYLDKGYQSGFELWGTEGRMRFAMHSRPSSGLARALEWCDYRTGGDPKTETFEDGPGAYPLFVQRTVEAAANSRAPLMTPAESLHLLETIEAGYVSAQKGVLVRVPMRQ